MIYNPQCECKIIDGSPLVGYFILFYLFFGFVSLFEHNNKWKIIYFFAKFSAFESSSNYRFFISISLLSLTSKRLFFTFCLSFFFFFELTNAMISFQNYTTHQLEMQRYCFRVHNFNSSVIFGINLTHTLNSVGAFVVIGVYSCRYHHENLNIPGKKHTRNDEENHTLRFKRSGYYFFCFVFYLNIRSVFFLYYRFWSEDSETKANTR